MTIEMTDYERFIFDLKGFIVIDSVLSEDETNTVRDHLTTLAEDPENLPEHHRAPMAGPAELPHRSAVSPSAGLA